MQIFQHKNIFFSLKWKYALIISSVMLLLYFIMSWGVYYKAKSDFEKQVHKQQLEYINVLQDLISHSNQIIEQLIDSLAQIKLAKDSVRNTKSFIALNSSDLQLTWGLDTIRFYPANKSKQPQWGTALPALRTLYQSVINKESPQHFIFCQQKCVLYVAMPILIQGKLEGIVSIGKSISETLITFARITQADIGVLAKNKIPAMTHAEQNRPLITHFLAQNDLLKNNMNHSESQFTQIFTNNQHYYLSFSAIKLNKNAYFIIINNIEKQYQELLLKRNNIIFSGLLGLLITLVILFYLLEKSLKRIKYFSSALPFLSAKSSNRFHKTRAILANIKHSKYAYDELDQLSLTSIKLTEQLEHLEDQSHKKSQEIKLKNSELKNERDFIQQLIETAPIYIVTQSMTGQIVSANQRCARLFKMDHDEIVTFQFEQLFTKKESQHAHLLENLRLSKSAQIVSIDDQLSTKHGIDSCISWIHSIISHKDSQHDDQILSLGIDITERKQAEEQAVWIATHDPLTNLHNRRYFHGEFEQVLNVARRYNNKIALLYLDLDQFKVINDSQGHAAGDRLLVQVAERLSRLTRKSDLLCRLGGDEFAIVTPVTGIKNIISLADKINQLMKELVLEKNKNNNSTYQVGFSIGIALFPEHGESIRKLLTHADLAMYRAKESGFNQYHIYNPANNYHQELNKKLKWKQFIEQTIDKKRLQLYYQPILDLQTQNISHYECLLRITKNNNEIMEPAEFIQYAEKLGLIENIDILVINMAIKKHIELQQTEDKKHLKLAINLSGQSIINENIKTEIKSLLSKQEVQSDKIIFEITETSAVTNFNSAQAFIHEIRNLGCQIALDDFGSGFSSFYYLKNMSFDYIKIDGAFIQRIETNKEDKIFVKALSEVAHALGKKTIAEFVETEAIINILKELHIDYAQGYHISIPRPTID